jgi:hypothetical protein
MGRWPHPAGPAGPRSHQRSANGTPPAAVHSSTAVQGSTAGQQWLATSENRHHKVAAPHSSPTTADSTHTLVWLVGRSTPASARRPPWTPPFSSSKRHRNHTAEQAIWAVLYAHRWRHIHVNRCKLCNGWGLKPQPYLCEVNHIHHTCADVSQDNPPPYPHTQPRSREHRKQDLWFVQGLHIPL